MDPIAFLIKHAVVDQAALALANALREQQDRQREAEIEMLELDELRGAYEASKRSPTSHAITSGLGWGGLGAGTGALIGSLLGKPGMGALIGGGLGAATGGYLGAKGPGWAKENLKDWQAGEPMLTEPITLPGDQNVYSGDAVPTFQEVERPISPRARAVLEKMLAAG